MSDLSRRELLTLLAMGAGISDLPRDSTAREPTKKDAALNPLRIRTITAGVQLTGPQDIGPVEQAIARLERAKRRAHDAGYEVQTLRVATNPLIAPLDARSRQAALSGLRRLDSGIAGAGALLSIGPVLTANEYDAQLGEWAMELANSTRTISFSVAVSSDDGGIHWEAIRSAVDVIRHLARVDETGTQNFRFAAAAGIPAGTPFFPVAHHRGPDAIAFGVESAGLVHTAFSESGQPAEAGGPRNPETEGQRNTQVKGRRRLEAEGRMRSLFDAGLAQIEQIGRQVAEAEKVEYLGIDPSPAPGLDRSIGSAIESFTGVPFGHPATLQACSTITTVLKSLKVKTCGYAGLMLPVLEDPTLARRANECRYGLQELLLYSTVCGTGLDVVPLPGDIDADALAQIIGDVATLAVRLRKPLSARLFPVPGKKAGDRARVADERLVECRVFDI
jgi:uncharacterized protein (UPF0210 family)